MKISYTLILLAFQFVPFLLVSQNGTTSAGSSESESNYSMCYTIGESIVTNYVSNNTYLSSGIIQPITNNSTVLSLSTTSFSVEVIEDKPSINWTIEQDLNESHFFIERGLDTENTETIARVEALSEYGNTSYDYIDYNILEPGVYYYKLKIYNINGSYAYSKTRAVMINASTDYSVEIFPNPTTNIINIQSDTLPLKSYELLSINGKKIVSGALHTNQISLANQSTGTYILRLNSDQQSIYKLVQKSND